MTPKKAYWAIPLRENQAIGQNDLFAPASMMDSKFHERNTCRREGLAAHPRWLAEKSV
jgi:hypothetical protein